MIIYIVCMRGLVTFTWVYSELAPSGPADIVSVPAGDCFLLMSGWEMLGLARVGQSDRAFQMLRGFMSQYTRTLLWGQRYSWQHEKMHGDDILTGALIGLASGLQASFGE
jgi:hypothetical protein